MYEAPHIDSGQLQMALNRALAMNGIRSFNNIHIVQMGGQQFYQVLIDSAHQDIRYISTVSGRLLADGDRLYAQFLARRFLSGNGQNKTLPETEAASDQDCCIRAALNIRNSPGAKIIAVEKITGFKGAYKYINRLLPVYKVSFDRGDGIRIYVETAGSRFAYAVDDRRAAFDRFFGWFHTWEWMDALGTVKYFIMVLITGIALLTTLMGLYIFCITKTKKPGNPLLKARRNHRYTSLVASLFTLMFAFSGGFHALENGLSKKQLPSAFSPQFAASAIDLNVARLDSLTGHSGIGELSLCTINNHNYWQVQLCKKQQDMEQQADLMKSMEVHPAPLLYVDAENGQLLQDGDRLYAQYLAQAFHTERTGVIRSATLVTKFTDEYNFINKRLPVWKVSYNTKDHKRFYIETKTGVLAACIRDKDLVEGYSFALLHKHHFMDWGGKTTRDISTMFGAGMQIAMVVIGMVLYWRARKKKRVHPKSFPAGHDQK
ncbi:hypothetical protein A8C56_01725 [Niabella ginsenosidivorans]|uniref:PepSY domain-containing protein n=2 Tax=Niabella ginsenosidivorans TaxID=1176587 RepID=A0A1A9HZX1_9BACT|nr:hypothetical protein A8C56_01725 [Niabella ginsenosidivorans]